MFALHQHISELLLDLMPQVVESDYTAFGKRIKGFFLEALWTANVCCICHQCVCVL